MSICDSSSLSWRSPVPRGSCCWSSGRMPGNVRASSDFAQPASWTCRRHRGSAGQHDGWDSFQRDAEWVAHCWPNSASAAGGPFSRTGCSCTLWGVSASAAADSAGFRASAAAPPCWDQWGAVESDSGHSRAASAVPEPFWKTSAEIIYHFPFKHFPTYFEAAILRFSLFVNWIFFHAAEKEDFECFWQGKWGKTATYLFAVYCQVT